jgi:hypothetical protein
METPASQWYFAYGSNLCASVFLQRRGINPLDSKVVRIDNHSLCFNVLFLPYSDPAMAGLRVRKWDEPRLDMPVHGVAYLLKKHDFVKMIVSEGYVLKPNERYTISNADDSAGVAYKILNVNAVELTNGSNLAVTTLVARREFAFQEERQPSERYMVRPP